MHWLLLALLTLLAGVLVKAVLFPAVSAQDPEDMESETVAAAAHYTPESLYKYNGHDDMKIYLAVKGRVFDVLAGRQFYGPSGPYANFAGHDASRGLALNLFDAECVRGIGEPVDDLADLSPEEQDALDGWEEHFEKKYPVVGTFGA